MFVGFKVVFKCLSSFRSFLSEASSLDQLNQIEPSQNEHAFFKHFNQFQAISRIIKDGEFLCLILSTKIAKISKNDIE